MLKGYWIAFGQFLKGIGKPLGIAQPAQAYAEMFLLAGFYIKNIGNEVISQKETRKN
jgi:hypothetical protein